MHRLPQRISFSLLSIRRWFGPAHRRADLLVPKDLHKQWKITSMENVKVLAIRDGRFSAVLSYFKVIFNYFVLVLCDSLIRLPVSFLTYALFILYRTIIFIVSLWSLVPHTTPVITNQWIPCPRSITYRVMIFMWKSLCRNMQIKKNSFKWRRLK